MGILKELRASRLVNADSKGVAVTDFSSRGEMGVNAG